MAERLKGIVAKSTGSWYRVFTEDGRTLDCRIKGKFRLDDSKATNPIAVGDSVEVEWDEQNNSCTITDLHERRNHLIRQASNLSKLYHIVAANIDLAVVVGSIVKPRTSQGFIDRFLVTAEAYGIRPLIVFNKLDVYNDKDFEKYDFFKKMYTDIGYEFVGISVLRDEGIEVIKKFTKNKTSLFFGHSGVGKSTLLNKMVPGLELKTQDISKSFSKGKHTTTFAEMHRLDDETFIIDTPGIKEFGLADFSAEEIGHFFPEMGEALHDCKFNNCLHIDEPDCAVREKLEKGDIYEERFRSYLSILDSLNAERRR